MARQAADDRRALCGWQRHRARSARIIAEQLSPRLGQPVIVDNKGGANGSIAGGIVAHAPADGYTLMMATAATHAGNPNLMKAVPYDSLADFAPTGFCGSIQFALAVRTDSGIATVADFVARAKAAKPPLTYGRRHAVGARHHRDSRSAHRDSELVHVPYKAAPQALADVLSGQIDMTFVDVGHRSAAVQGGQGEGAGRWLRHALAADCRMCRPSRKQGSAPSRSMPGSW